MKTRAYIAQRGFSMLEVMIAAALLGIIVVATAGYLANSERDAKNQSVREMQRVVYERIRLAIESPEMVNTTNLVAGGGAGMSPGNKFLWNCTGNSNCTATNSAAASQHSLFLFAPGATDNSDPIAGPEGQPVPYSVTGERNCTPSKVNCRFGAVAYFWATCPLGPGSLPTASCPEPMAVNFRVRLVPLFAGAGAASGSPTNPYPITAEWNASPYAFAYTLRMSDIRLAYVKTCPADQVQVGTTAAGLPVCRCFNGSTPVGGTCPAQRCTGPRDTMVGYQSNGRINCVGPNDNNKCWDVALYDNGDCGAGAWLVRVEFGECFTGDASKGKSGSKEVTCQNDKGRCCLSSM